jgi:hypothetical protein
MSIISGLFGLGSTLLGGLLGNSAQRSANRTNIMLNRENRDWMEDMSNTAYQRGTKDMLAAGLNPMLAYSQGGASTPSNSAATVRPVDAGAQAVGQAATNALGAMQTTAQTQKVMADTRLTNAEASIKEEQVPFAQRMAEWQFNNLQQQFYSEMAKMQLTDAQKAKINAELPLILEEYRSRIALLNEQRSSSKAIGDINRARLAGEKVQESVYETLGAGTSISRQAIGIILNRILNSK